MPGGDPAPVLGPDRHRQLRHHQHGVGGPRPRAGRRPQPDDPPHLYDGDTGGVPQRGAASLGMLGRGPQPLRDQRDPHDHIADHDEGEVVLLERGAHPGRQHQHPRHLQQRQQPVGHIVGVVGGGEPGEVHPSPPDREEHRRVPGQTGGDVSLGERVMQLGRRLGDGYHERQVEQQLQRGRRAVLLARIAPAHRPPQRPGPLRDGSLCGGLLPGTRAACVLTAHPAAPGVGAADRRAPHRRGPGAGPGHSVPRDPAIGGLLGRAVRVRGRQLPGTAGNGRSQGPSVRRASVSGR